MFDDFKVKPGKKVDLSKIDPSFKDGMDKKELVEKMEKNVAKISELQEILYAENKRSLLIVFQALDGGGKDGTIKTVFGPVNPQGCIVTSFKGPTSLELAHDFLWRIHKEVPEKGMLKIFNRSHYEDVLVVRVHKRIDDKECERRFEHINNFEKLLSDNGTTILKFFLYISKDEQKERFEERLSMKEKNWKFSKYDLEERKFWDDYIAQFEKVFKNTSTDYAPWHIVPANSNKFRNYMVSEIVKKTLEDMDLKYPPAEEGLDKVIIK